MKTTKKISLLLMALAINFAYAVPLELDDGNMTAQVNTVNEVDTKIEQLKNTLTAQITEVKEFAKEVEEIAKLNGFKSFVNKIFPIGSIYITYSNQTPPLQGDGITAENCLK